MPAWLIWVIVIVVVVAIVAALALMTGKRRTAQRHQRALQLREEATAQASGLTESHRQAEELRAEADLARSEAQRAEERAATAEQAHRMEQAGYEDKVREADRLDPEVDDGGGNYEPDVWNDERSESTGDTPAAEPPPTEPPPTEPPPTEPPPTEPPAAAPSTSAEGTHERTRTGPRHAASPEETSGTQRGAETGGEPPTNHEH